MITENTTRQWIVSLPQTDPNKAPSEIARITACQTSKLLVLLFDKKYSIKELRSGFNLTPAFARNLGDALLKAADLADAAWKEPPTPATT